MAWRNVWRNRRRSLVTVAAMSLALLTMILYTGLIEGYLEGMERNVLDLEVGDVQVFAGFWRSDWRLPTRRRPGLPFEGSTSHETSRSVMSRINSTAGDGSTPPIPRASSSVAGWRVHSMSISAASCWSLLRVRTAAWPTNSTM